MVSRPKLILNQNLVKSCLLISSLSYPVVSRYCVDHGRTALSWVNQTALRTNIDVLDERDFT